MKEEVKSYLKNGNIAVVPTSTTDGSGGGGDTIEGFTYDTESNKLTIITDSNEFSVNLTTFVNIILNDFVEVNGIFQINDGNFITLNQSDEEFDTLLESYRSDKSFRSGIDDRYTDENDGGVEIFIKNKDQTSLASIGATNESAYFENKDGKVNLATVDQIAELEARITALEGN